MQNNGYIRARLYIDVTFERWIQWRKKMKKNSKSAYQKKIQNIFN